MGRRNCNPGGNYYSGWLLGGGTNGSALGCGDFYKTNHKSWFIYGPFSTASATAGELDFNFYVNSEPGYDFFRVMATNINISGSWFGLSYSGTWAWQSGTLDLSDDWCNSGTETCLGRSNVWIAFVFESDGSTQVSYGAIVDNIVLRLCNAANCVDGAPVETASPWLSPAVRDYPAALPALIRRPRVQA